MLVDSFIDVPTWDEARWKGVLYLIHPSEPPLMTLLFTHRDAAIEIWEQWRRQFGSGDASDRLHVAIVTGVKPSEPFTYRVLVGSRIGSADAIGAKVVFSTVRPMR
jgi:hypothetical protein